MDLAMEFAGILNFSLNFHSLDACFDKNHHMQMQHFLKENKKKNNPNNNKKNKKTWNMNQSSKEINIYLRQKQIKYVNPKKLNLWTEP